MAERLLPRMACLRSRRNNLRLRKPSLRLRKASLRLQKTGPGLWKATLRPAAAAFSLHELLIVAMLLGMASVLGLRQGAEALARERVESASRRIALGLERGRLAAVRSGSPCGLELAEAGWQAPLDAALPGCPGLDLPAGEGIDPGVVRVEHNLPPLVRFTSNGLVLDGGTVRITADGTALERCLVMALPLGVVRLGRWHQQTCQVDPSL